MTDEELSKAMDDLGQLMHNYEEAYDQFVMDHQEESTKIEAQKKIVREEILKRQVGWKSMKLECTWRRGAIRWDSDKLKDYEKTYPFLKECKKVGEPTVGFRTRSEGMSDEG